MTFETGLSVTLGEGGENVTFKVSKVGIKKQKHKFYRYFTGGNYFWETFKLIHCFTGSANAIDVFHCILFLLAIFTFQM